MRFQNLHLKVFNCVMKCFGKSTARLVSLTFTTRHFREILQRKRFILLYGKMMYSVLFQIELMWSTDYWPCHTIFGIICITAEILFSFLFYFYSIGQIIYILSISIRHLYKDELIPKNTQIIGYARSDLTVDKLRAKVEPFMKVSLI